MPEVCLLAKKRHLAQSGGDRAVGLGLQGFPENKMSTDRVPRAIWETYHQVYNTGRSNSEKSTMQSSRKSRGRPVNNLARSSTSRGIAT